jgi:hypothetical protein
MGFTNISFGAVFDIAYKGQAFTHCELFPEANAASKKSGIGFEPLHSRSSVIQPQHSVMTQQQLLYPDPN